MVLVQVRYTFVKGNLKLEMPSPFSVVIQVCLPSQSFFSPVSIVSQLRFDKIRNQRKGHGISRSHAKTMKSLQELGCVLADKVF